MNIGRSDSISPDEIMVDINADTVLVTVVTGMGLPRFGGQASGLHRYECTGVDGHLLVVDRAEVANG